MKKTLPLVASFIVFAAAVGAYTYLSVAVQGSVERATTAGVEASNLTAKDNALQSTGIALRDSKEFSDTLATFVSSGNDVVRGIELLESAGRKSKAKLSLGTAQITTSEGWAYHEAVALTFSAEGTFAQLLRLLSEVENLPHLVRLENVSLQKPGKKEEWTAHAAVIFVKEKP